MLGDCENHRCASPPSPPDYHQPAPAPAPQRSWWTFSPEPYPPIFAPPRGGDDRRRRLITYALIAAAAAAVAFVSLFLLGVSVLVRRRQVRRQALHAAPAAPAAPTDADDDPKGGGRVVHHVWHIRTVGLDEAAIHSIAATRYREGAGLLGAADCTVCLGEFEDGELVRLLPKCGHAFHVPCIDTWLRAHVNCPLCRSDVLDPAVTTDGESSSTPPADPVEYDNAAAAQADATSEAVADHEQEEDGDHPEASPAEEDQHEQQPSLPEPLPRNVRRAASMGAALERLPEAAPEEEQSGRAKRDSRPPCAKASGSGHRSNLSADRSASVGIPRLFFSRHCRAQSSVLPL
jgi:hypothetical protein